MSEHFGKYDYSQIITTDDLRNLQRELVIVYDETPWYKWVTKWSIGVSIGVIIGLLHWISEGKGGIRNSTGELQ